jgi:hypothetical protein
MQPFVNPDMLNFVAKEKIARMQQHAEIANQARLCWAIRFISFNRIRPDYPAKPGSAKLRRQTGLAQS